MSISYKINYLLRKSDYFFENNDLFKESDLLASEIIYHKYELFEKTCYIQKSTIRKAGKRHPKVSMATAALGLARGTLGPNILIDVRVFIDNRYKGRSARLHCFRTKSVFI